MKILKNDSLRSLYLAIISLVLLGCSTGIETRAQSQSQYRTDTSLVQHPEWSKDANIYEVNIRQYSEQGTFKAFEKDLPRLQKMGIEIIWLMPVHPIGEKNRKGKEGSYYSIKDYTAVNPNFGSLEDFKSLVRRVHELDMKIIMDWVANHTAWDHHWTHEHPDWYTKDEEGNFKPPVEDWSDVIELDYEKREMRNAMAEAMKFWVREANIDGYRCDVAMDVPTDFWNRVRRELDEIKPVFMLAEAEVPEHHYKAFDMSYAWEFHHIMNEIAAGNEMPRAIFDYMSREQSRFADGAYRMYFTSNHDENSWNGTVFERFGEGARAFAVLVSTIDGMPLIYNGQEAAMKKRLEFFEKDPINWNNYSWQEFYTRLLKLKKRNKALWNGKYGGKFKKVESDNPNLVLYKRVLNNDEVFVMLNLSGQPQKTTVEQEKKRYIELFTGIERDIGGTEFSLEPWDYRVFEKQGE